MTTKSNDPFLYTLELMPQEYYIIDDKRFVSYGVYKLQLEPSDNNIETLQKIKQFLNDSFDDMISKRDTKNIEVEHLSFMSSGCFPIVNFRRLKEIEEKRNKETQEKIKVLQTEINLLNS